MGRRQSRNADEFDVFTGWRRLYKYTQRPGVTSAVKRRARRRERHEARFDVSDWAYEPLMTPPEEHLERGEN